MPNFHILLFILFCFGFFCNILKVPSKITLQLHGNMVACEKDSVNSGRGYFLSLLDVSEGFEQYIVTILSFRAQVRC